MTFDRATTLQIWGRANRVLASPLVGSEAKTFAKVAKDHAEVALGLDDAIKRMRGAAKDRVEKQQPPRR